jgi:CRP-like cAMP-binding protein
MDILELTRDEPDVTVADGEALIRADQTGTPLFVLVDGRLRVSRHGHVLAEFTEPGTVVGEIGLLLHTPASADVVSIGASTVRRMDDAERTFAGNPEFARHLATVLAQRLWRVSTFLSDLQDQYADRADTLGLMPDVLRELLGAHPAPVETGSDREDESPY